MRVGLRSDLLFVDDVVLLSSSVSELQLSLDRFAAECESAEMRISTPKSEAMVLIWKKVNCLLRFKEEILPQVGEFKYLWVLFTSEGRMEREIDRQIGAASAVSKVIERIISQKEVAEMSFVHRMAGLSIRGTVRGFAI